MKKYFLKIKPTLIGINNYKKELYIKALYKS